MIRRIYADNFRCLTNFEFRPGSIELLLGENGTGKSALFEVVTGLADVVLQRRSLAQAFPRSSTTRWERRTRQSFELDFESPEGLHTYSLVLEHPEDRPKPIIVEETVHLDGQQLFAFVEGVVQNGTQGGSGFRFNAEVSFLSLLDRYSSDPRAFAFKSLLEGIWHLALDPGSMEERSAVEADRPEASGRNFVAWYRAIVQEKQEVLAGLFEELRPVIPGFQHLRLDKISKESRTLKVVAESGSAPYELGIEELSGGQRALVFYYTLLHTAVEEGRVLLLDEPENFVALPEIQPWLIRFADRLEESGGQALVISHHPEVIDYLNEPPAWSFERKDGGPVRARRLQPDRDSGLQLSELIARGWTDGE